MRRWGDERTRSRVEGTAVELGFDPETNWMRKP
jgi:hypothetical protein